MANQLGNVAGAWLLACLCGSSATAQEPTTATGAHIEDASSKCKVWNPKPVDGEAVSWNGSCTDGYATGLGTVRWYLKGQLQNEVTGAYEKGEVKKPITLKYYMDDNVTSTYNVQSVISPEVYTGTVVEAKSGVVYARYEGGFKDGLRHGQGTTTLFENGAISRRVTGNHVTNLLEGIATTTYANGTTITASYVAGVANGPITTTFANGDQRIATVKANLLEGPATYIVKSTNQRSYEIWSKGKSVFSTFDKKLALPLITRFEVIDTRELIAFAGANAAAKITMSPFCKTLKRGKPFHLKAFSEALSAWDTVVLDGKACKIERIEIGI